MRIQCERCSTTYEFDETRLPPAGAPVRCTRCGHVFRAFPPGSAEKTWLGQPPAPPPGERRAAPAPEPPAPPPEAPVGARPAPASPGDTTVSGLAAELRSSRRRTWILPVVAVALVALAVAAWLLFAHRVPAKALGLRDGGYGLLLRDDRAGLERAVETFAAAAAASPSYAAARADEALALLLLSDDAIAEARPAEDRFRELEARHAREEKEHAPGWGAREADLVARMAVARAEAEPMREKARAQRERAVALLRGLAQDGKGERETSRALALYYGLDGDAERAAQAAGRAKDDPFVSAALVAAALRRAGGAPPAPETLAALERASAEHPEVLRARLVLALGLASAGQRDAAVAALDGVLSANPDHERAKALKAEILAPPAPAMPPVAVPAGAPPPQPTGKLPRLRAGERRASASRGG